MSGYESYLQLKVEELHERVLHLEKALKQIEQEAELRREQHIAAIARNARTARGAA